MASERLSNLQGHYDKESWKNLDFIPDVYQPSVNNTLYLDTDYYYKYLKNLHVS